MSIMLFSHKNVDKEFCYFYGISIAHIQAEVGEKFFHLKFLFSFHFPGVNVFECPWINEGAGSGKNLDVEPVSINEAWPSVCECQARLLMVRLFRGHFFHMIIISWK